MTFRSKLHLNVFGPAEFETEEQRDLYDYVYDHTLDRPGMAVLFWGYAMGLARQNPEWTFWQVLAELRRSLLIAKDERQSHP